MDSRRTPGPQTCATTTWSSAVFAMPAFSVQLAAHAFSALDSYISSFALQERGLAFGTSAETSELAREFLRHFRTEEYPRLAELTVEHVGRPGYDHGDEFAFGLDHVLDGLDRALQA